MRSEPKDPPIELIRKGDSEERVIAVACGTCGRVHGATEQGRELVKSCCGRRWCDCGNEIKGRGWLICDACQWASQVAKAAERKAKAPRESADDHDGPVCWDEQNRFYEDICDAVEDVLEHEAIDGIVPAEQTLWACSVSHLVLDADDLIIGTLESQDHHEGADVPRGGYQALGEFLEKWNKEWGETVTTWRETRTLIIDAFADHKEK